VSANWTTIIAPRKRARDLPAVTLRAPSRKALLRSTVEVVSAGTIPKRTPVKRARPVAKRTTRVSIRSWSTRGRVP
jgi:hypothetical protein